MSELVDNIDHRVKIMHIVHSLEVGGLENGVVNIVNHLNEERFLHSICCLTISGSLVKRIKRPDVRIFEMKKRDKNDLRLLVRLKKLLEQEKPHIVHTRNWGAIDAIFVSRLTRVPVIVHGEHGREATDPEGKNRKRNFIRKLMVPFVNRFTTVSQDLKEWLIKEVGIPSSRVTTIINGVNTERFFPHDKIICTRNAGIRSEEVIIGTVGRLDPVKNHAMLLHCFKDLSRSHKGIRLMIVGDGPKWGELQALSNVLGIADKVIFTGKRDDIPELMNNLDIFVLPSLAEGISNTILEAMATGLPVIATDVGGNRELVVDNQTGFLVPKNDLIALGQAIEFYLSNPLKIGEHGKAGRKRVVELFALNRMLKQYEHLYLSLLDRKPSFFLKKRYANNQNSPFHTN
jgi:sugar transferase (PEP-CTERM/EpsH1 system associated)